MDADRRDFPILIRADRYLLLVTRTGPPCERCGVASVVRRDLGRTMRPSFHGVTTGLLGHGGEQETGYAKRVAVDDIPLTKRGREGVRVSSAPLAAAVVVTAADDVAGLGLRHAGCDQVEAVVLRGERLVRPPRRGNPRRGRPRLSRQSILLQRRIVDLDVLGVPLQRLVRVGVRVIALGPGDSAAKVALIPETPPGLHPGVACRAASSELDVSPPVALN